MASKFGSRPVGSDGSDHWHRESIAWQYKVSSENKSRLRYDLFVHFQLIIMMFVRLLPAFTAMFGFSVQALRRWDLPAPRPWEYAWSITMVVVVIGWKSTPQNKSFLLKQFMLGTVVFGILPVLYGFYDLSDHLKKYIFDKKFTFVLFGYPAVVVWCFFLAIALQLHLFAMYFSVVLLRAWKPRGEKKIK